MTPWRVRPRCPAASGPDRARKTVAADFQDVHRLVAGSRVSGPRYAIQGAVRRGRVVGVPPVRAFPTANTTASVPITDEWKDSPPMASSCRTEWRNVRSAQPTFVQYIIWLICNAVLISVRRDYQLAGAGQSPGRGADRAARRRAQGRRARGLQAPARRPRHRAGPAGALQDRGVITGYGPERRSGRARLRGDGVRHPGDPPRGHDPVAERLAEIPKCSRRTRSRAPGTCCAAWWPGPTPTCSA